MANIDVLRLPEILTNIVGLHPGKQSIYKKLNVLTYISLALLLWYLIIVEIMIVYKDLSILSEALEALTILIHASGKLLSFATNQQTILIMLKTRKLFWSTDKCNPILEKECNTILRFTRWLTYILLFFGNLVFALYSSKIFLSETIELPILCYIPQGWNVELLAALQMLVCFNLVETMLAHDIIFMALSVELTVQLKLLGGCLKALDMTQIKNEKDYGIFSKKVNEYVEHHNLLIGHYNNISKLLTFSFFAQYAVCTLTTCFELYIILESEVVKFDILLRGIVYVMVISMEVSMYCFTSVILSEEMYNVGNAVWHSGWYGNNFLGFQKSLGLIILNTNQQKIFSAGGIMLVNLNTYTNVFKTAFSFYTFMRAFQ